MEAHLIAGPEDDDEDLIASDPTLQDQILGSVAALERLADQVGQLAECVPMGVESLEALDVRERRGIE